MVLNIRSKTWETLMTLENTLIKSLSEWRPASRDSLLLTDRDSGWTVQVTADHCELLGSQLWEVTASRSAPPANVKLTDWVTRIVANSAGLQEPLRVLEVDEHAQQALLRSVTPVRRDDKLYYYEALVKGTTAVTLRRYQTSQDGPSRREQVPFILTHETAASVVKALTA
jgi:hypothetical protein